MDPTPPPASFSILALPTYLLQLLVCLYLLQWALYQLYWHLLCQPTFAGKSVFITGASSGIGEELAKRFVGLGAKVVVLSARRVKELERVKEECERLMPKKAE